VISWVGLLVSGEGRSLGREVCVRVEYVAVERLSVFLNGTIR
jgi:hypothetical protein